MSPLQVTLHLVVGLAVGLALALAHAFASRRAAASALEQQSVARLLIGFPIRVAVPGAALFGLSLLSLWALGGGMLAFIVGQRLALTKVS